MIRTKKFFVLLLVISGVASLMALSPYDPRLCCPGCAAAIALGNTGRDLQGSAIYGGDSGMASAVPALAAAPTVSVSSPAAAGGWPPDAPAPVQAPSGYWEISFAHLASYKFEPPPDDAPKINGLKHRIAPMVRGLDGKRIALRGYMMPLKLDAGKTTNFLIIRSPMVCCYGQVPAFNEWVEVTTKEPVDTVMDTPILFYGTLHVGEAYENGALVSLYQLDGEKISREDAK